MKRIEYVLIVSVLSVLSACTSVDSDLGGSLSIKVNRIHRFQATTEQSDPETKVFADGKMRVLWNSGDMISIFNQSTYNSQYAFSGEDGDNSGNFDEIPSGGFHSGNQLSNIYAVYPYSNSNKIDNDGEIITLTLPAVQQYKEHSFGNGANAMVAVTDNSFLAFKNLGGYLQLRLYGDNIKVSSITIRGNNSEKIAGKANVSIVSREAPVVTMDNTATDAITLICDPPVKIGSSAQQYTDFWFVIRPVTLRDGFTVTVTDDLGGVFQKTTTKSMTISRSTIEWMSALQVIPDYGTSNVVFADNYFKAYCISKFDSNKDGVLSVAEARKVTAISVSTDNITSLQGIEYFTNLSSLICRGTSNNGVVKGQLVSLDISNNKALETLECDNNQLTTLDVSWNTKLSKLSSTGNSSLKEIWLNAGQTINNLEYDIEVATIKYKTSLFSFKKAYALPEHRAGDIIDLYETQAGINGYAQQVGFKKTIGKPDSLIISIKPTDKETFRYIVDTIWNGNQASEKLLRMKTGLHTVYEDFSRAYLYDVNSEGIRADRAILESYAKKVRNEYDSLLNILENAPEGQGKLLIDAWSQRVEKEWKDIRELATKVDKYVNYDYNAENNVYIYEDKVFRTVFYGPRLSFGYDYSGRLISQATDNPSHFILDTPSTPWFDGVIAHPLTIAPTKADSILVFNAVKDFFATIATINEKAVPYLKYITTVYSGSFRVDSVRADKIDFAGLQMKRTDAYLDGRGIHRSAAYDNKGIDDLTVPPAVNKYVDAFTNLMQLFNHYLHGDALTSPFYNATDATYFAGTAGVEVYVQYVKDFKSDNTKCELGTFMKVFDGYSAADFTKYTNMSDEGKALANWMDACQKYYGVEGFAGLGEKVFFNYETFTEPTNVVVFDGIPDYYKDPKKGVTGIGRVDVMNPWTYQFDFVARVIINNLEQYYGYMYDAYDYVVYNNDMVMKSKVFELLEVEYLAYLAANEKTPGEAWEELGVILSQVKSDLDAVTND